MADMTYAVHTGTCTYLLDDEGICLWTLSPGGPASGTDRCVGAQFVACLDLSAPGGLVGELRLGASALFVRREHGKFVLLRTTAIENVEYRPQSEDEARAQREVLASQDATAVLTDEIAAAAAQPFEQAHTHRLEPATPPPAPPPRAPEPPAQPLPVQAQLWALQQAQAAAQRASQAPPQRPPDPWEAPPDALSPPRWAEPAPLHLAYEVPEGAEALDEEDLVSISVTEVTLTMPLYRPPVGAPPAPLPPPPHPPPVRHAAPPAYALPLPPPVAPPRRSSSFPPPPEPPQGESGPPTPRGPPPGRHAVVGPGRRLR